MPSTSPKQAKTMQAAAKNPAFAKKVGIPTKVAKEFAAADKKAGPMAKGKGKGMAPPFAKKGSKSGGKRGC